MLEYWYMYIERVLLTHSPGLGLLSVCPLIDHDMIVKIAFGQQPLWHWNVMTKILSLRPRATASYISEQTTCKAGFFISIQRVENPLHYPSDSVPSRLVFWPHEIKTRTDTFNNRSSTFRSEPTSPFRGYAELRAAITEISGYNSLSVVKALWNDCRWWFLITPVSWL